MLIGDEKKCESIVACGFIDLAIEHLAPPTPKKALTTSTTSETHSCVYGTFGTPAFRIFSCRDTSNSNWSYILTYAAWFSFCLARSFWELSITVKALYTKKSFLGMLLTADLFFSVQCNGLT
jgi:hypothetical protein